MPYRSHSSAVARRVPRRDLHVWPAAFALTVLIAGCGTPRYLPLQILSPEPQADSTARFGDLRVGLRVGYEWIEILLWNEGSTPVEVSLGEATVSFKHGHAHQLVRSAFLDAFHGALWNAQSTVESSPRPVRWTYAPASVFASGGHRFPRFLQHALAQEPQVLKPGARLEEVLYPGEHIRLEMQGSVMVTPLLCERPSGAPDDGEFEVRFPVKVEGNWRTLTIAARLQSRRL